ncbi:MAG: hypothetical protein HOC18_10565 [Candidatus Marinimicrobia bacterium]|nr:hypothetical protein [Candidatus Neomarinimicrobiota bacterium]
MKSLIAVPFLIGSLPLLGSVAIGYNYLKSKRESNKYLFWGGISGFAFAGWMASNMIMTRYTESLDFDAESFGNEEEIFRHKQQIIAKMMRDAPACESCGNLKTYTPTEYNRYTCWSCKDDPSWGAEDSPSPSGPSEEPEPAEATGSEPSNENFSAEMDANVLFRQLGGNRFRAMTGAKDFMKDGNSLRMKIMKNNTGGNHLIITLNSNDLYDMRFESHRMNRKTYELTIKVKAEETNIPASNLQRVFTELSGLYTHMAEQSFNAESFSAEAETWTEDNVCLKCNSPFDGCSCERCPQCDEFWNDGWLNCDECFSCDDCCRESCPHLWDAESTGCYECGQDYEEGDVFRNCDLCDVLLCSGCNRPCEGCSNTVCNSHRCSKDCCDGAFCDECHEEEFGAESFSAEFVPPYNRGKGLDFGRDNKGRYRRKLTIPISETAQKEIRQDRKRRYLVSGGQEQERCVECRRPVSANEVASLRNVILCKSCVGSLEKSN